MISLIPLISNLWSIILALIGISFLVAFHEFGHLIFAKLFGVYVPSFSIGFGPRLIEKKIGETTYCISAIPLGGYVEVAGNAELGQGDQKAAHLAGKRSLSSKPYWQKLLIMLGGILFNIIFAYLALSFLFFKGAPAIGSWATKEQPVVYTVLPKSAAAQAGLEKEDKVTAIEGLEMPTIDSIAQYMKVNTKPQLTLTVDRQGKSQNIPVTLTADKDNKPISNLGLIWHTKPLSLVDSFKAAFNATISLISQTFKALVSIVKERNTNAVGGPLMLISQIKDGAGLGYKLFLFLLAFISINLAVLNVLPLPIFDGGQIVFETIEAITGKPLSEKTRYNIHYYSWLAVMALVVYLSYNDIIRLFFPSFSLTAFINSIKNFIGSFFSRA